MKAADSKGSLEQWQESEPERLDAQAERWERASRDPAERVPWLAEMACHARKAAANLRAMRAARLRAKAGGL